MRGIQALHSLRLFKQKYNPIKYMLGKELVLLLCGESWILDGLLWLRQSKKLCRLTFKEVAIELGQNEAYFKCFEFAGLSNHMWGFDEGEVVIKDDSHSWNEKVSKLWCHLLNRTMEIWSKRPWVLFEEVMLPVRQSSSEVYRILVWSSKERSLQELLNII